MLSVKKCKMHINPSEIYYRHLILSVLKVQKSLIPSGFSTSSYPAGNRMWCRKKSLQFIALDKRMWTGSKTEMSLKVAVNGDELFAWLSRDRVTEFLVCRAACEMNLVAKRTYLYVFSAFNV